MTVRVDEAGEQRLAAQIDDRGRIALELQHLVPIANGQDLPSFTAMAPAVGWASLTVMMGPPV